MGGARTCHLVKNFFEKHSKFILYLTLYGNIRFIHTYEIVFSYRTSR